MIVVVVVVVVTIILFLLFCFITFEPTAGHSAPKRSCWKRAETSAPQAAREAPDKKKKKEKKNSNNAILKTQPNYSNRITKRTRITIMILLTKRTVFTSAAIYFCLIL